MLNETFQEYANLWLSSLRSGRTGCEMLNCPKCNTCLIYKVGKEEREDERTERETQRSIKCEY